MSDIGYIALLVAFLLTLYGIVISIMGARRKDQAMAASGRNALHLVTLLITISTLAMVYLLATDNFSNEYVASHSERALPMFYKIATLWGGQSGSLLFWSFLLAIYSSWMIAALWKKEPRRGPWLVASLLGVQLFFLLISVYASNPFSRLWVLADGNTVGSVFRPPDASLFIPADGTGLNPLLQNYWMVAHPIFLYLGYVGLALPFAYATASLLSGDLDDSWVQRVRLWNLIPWITLTIGIILGSQWAYIELGWGGFWAWDPVENASLIPWLTATAFLHSIMIQEHRGMLKVWNMILAFLGFWLAIVGTFITRSGIIDSVHSFALSNIGPLFLAYIALTFLAYFILLAFRLAELNSDAELDSLLSREAAFLYVNVLFVAAAFVTLFGTLFPIISEAMGDAKIAVNAPYFNKVDGPIFLGILLLMGLGPLLGWRRTSNEMLEKSLAVPLALALAVAGAVAILITRNWVPIVSWGLVALVLGTILWEYYRGAAARRRALGESWLQALGRVMVRNQRRYGGYLVHLGVVLMVFGMVGAVAFQHNLKISIPLNDSVELGGYTFTYTGLEQNKASNHDEVIATVEVTRGQRQVATMRPSMNFYDSRVGKDSGPTTEVGLHSTIIEDVYVVLNGYERGGQLAAFELFVNPLMLWMWIGGLVMVFGTLFAMWPMPRRASSRSKVRQPATQPAAS
jgi:cytochrome c-type biogenesis protein CcmF